MRTASKWHRWWALLALPILAAPALRGAPASSPAAAHATTLPSPATPLSSSLPAPPPAPASTSQPPDDPMDLSTRDPEAVAEQTMEIQAEQRDGIHGPAIEAPNEQRPPPDQDWMLHDYTARLKKQGLAQSPSTDPGLLTATPVAPASTTPDALDAARPDTLSDAAAGKSLLNPLTPPPVSREQETTPAAKTDPGKFMAFTSMQPLLPPITAPKTAPHDPWADVSAAANNLVSPSSSGLPEGLGLNGGGDSSLGIPGMTAAQSGLGVSSDRDFNIQDPLPDQPMDRQKKFQDQNNFLVPTAPTSDVSEFFKRQSEALQPPMAPTALRPPTVLARPVAPVRPEPMAKPAVSGIRSHVDDPFDILQR